MADANSQVEVIKHLSSEIAAQTDYLAQLRSRVALTILIGPFVVFGSFLIATKGVQVPLQLGKLQITVAVLASAAYLALGWYGALLDRQVTNQCDRWRCSILKISVSKVLQEEDLVFPHRNLIAYMIGWILILVAFISIAVLLYSMLPQVSNGTMPCLTTK